MMKNRKTLHLISQAHLDPAWLWPWRDGVSEAITTTQSALNLMREYKEFRFTCSSAAMYRWVMESDPRLFAEMKKRVRQGRWEIAGGWIVQPDCNLPSGESFVRHALYGKEFFTRHFGETTEVGYNVDSFGHSGGLPKILKSSGYRFYVFMRPGDGEPADLPRLFWWEADDGSRVLTWRIGPTSYCQPPSMTADQLEEKIRLSAATGFVNGIRDAAFFLGIGNHGGGPSRSHLERVIEMQKDTTLPKLRFSTLKECFARVEEQAEEAPLPAVLGDLHHHAVGCYSAQGEVKALNRRAERTLFCAETAATMASRHLRAQYPKDTLNQAWWDLLFNQFHDILSGSCVQSDYIDSRDSLGRTCHVALTETVRSVHAFSRKVDTRAVKSSAICLFNPLPWKRTARIGVDLFPAPHGGEWYHCLKDAKGGKIPIQWGQAESCFGPHEHDWKKLIAEVQLPACGYKMLELTQDKAPVLSNSARADRNGVSGKAGRMSLSKKALGLSSFRFGKELQTIVRAIGFVVVEDPDDTWGHGVTSYRREIGRPTRASASLLETGPHKAGVRVRGKWKNSDIYLDVYAYRTLPVIELVVHVNWQEELQYLKLEIPTCLKKVSTLADGAFTANRRAPDGGEEPCGRWVMLEGQLNGKSASLAVITQSTYAYDCLGGLLRMGIARSGHFAQYNMSKPHKDRNYPHLDQGWQERRFWLWAGWGGRKLPRIARLASEMDVPAEYAMDSAHPGDWPWEQSWLEVTPENIIVSAVKESEDGKGMIVRLVETAGKTATAQLRLDDDRFAWKGTVKPRQVITLKISSAGKDWHVRESDLLEG